MKLTNIKINNTGLLFLFLSFIACSDKPENDYDKPENDLSKFNLKGKVKSFSQESYEVKVRNENIIMGRKINGGINEPDDSFSLINDTFRIDFKFDENGNKIEENNFNSKGQLHYKLIYKYNEKGNLFESSSFPNKYGKSKQTYHYNTKGKLTKINYYRNEEFFVADNYQYDDKGNLIKYSSWVIDPPKLQWQTNYTYNQEGNVIKTDDDNWVTTYEYDDKGNKIVEKQINKHDNGVYKSIYRYDKDENLIEKIEENSRKGERQRSFFKYEFDKNDNWTKRITFIFDKPSAISIRKYEYF